MNKIIAIVAIAVIIIVGLSLFKATVAKAETVTASVSNGSIEALISQPAK